MKKQTMLIIGLVAIVLLGIGGYFLFQQSNNASLNELAKNGSEQKVSPRETFSFKELLGMSVNQQCTFTDKETANTGTVFASNSRVRADFTGKIKGEEEKSHMIVDDSTMYLWMEGAEEGMKMSRQSVEEIQQDESIADKVDGYVDVNKEVDYSCQPWNANATVFIPPTEVSFVDYSEMMNDAKEMMQSDEFNSQTQDPKAMCAQCEQLPADAKAQCKQSLKCN